MTDRGIGHSWGCAFAARHFGLPEHVRAGTPSPWGSLIDVVCELISERKVVPQREGDQMLSLDRQFTAHVRAAIRAVVILTGLLIPATVSAGPTPEEYVSHVGGDAKIVSAGTLVLDGQRMTCGHRPTVLDSQLDDYGAAYPGFLILNPKLISRVPTVVKKWIFAHECGHQFRGPDEETADCFAVQRGRRQGWLDEAGLEAICSFISPAKGDSMHFSGSHRCQIMRQCYSEPGIR